MGQDKEYFPLGISIKALKKNPTLLYSLSVSDDLNFSGSYYKMKFKKEKCGDYQRGKGWGEVEEGEGGDK